MCGIAGIVNFSDQPVDRSYLQRMNDLQRHRGPDGQGIYLCGSVGLGHRRLAIIDPDGGHQPFLDKERGIALTYNGEVYNYREIRDSINGSSFRTQSDTEVVLRAFERWGIGCLEQFRGMFGFAIFDEHEQVLYLVRDRLGIKPVYYALDNKRLVFASELKAVVSVPGVGRNIDKDALANYLHLQYVPTPRTIYGDVRKMEPGTYLKVHVNSGKVSQHRYWDVEPRTRPWNEALLKEELHGFLDDIMRIYVRSDVPFGTFLSGGIDSSMVTAHLADCLDQPVQSFTIGFSEEEYSELSSAVRASETLGTNHHETIVSPEMGLSIMRRIVHHFGEPFGDSSSVPTFFVSNCAAEKVKMVLSGDGGDEIFAGYNSYPALFEQFCFSGSAWRRFGLRQKERLKALLGRPRGETMGEAHNRWRQTFPSHMVNRLMMGPTKFEPPDAPLCPPSHDMFIPLQFQDIKTYLLDDILTKVDRMSMANSLEVRVPLLDHKLVEFAFSLPLEARLRAWPGKGVVTKYLFKKCAERYFSEDFIHRKKMGFGIPVMEWLQGPFRSFVMETLGETDSPMYLWLDQTAVANVVADFYKGRNFAPSHLWVLLMLKLWFDDVHEPAVP